MKPLLTSSLRVLLLLSGIVPVLLIAFQHRLIYFPRAYTSEDLQRLPRDLKKVSYRTAQGQQAAFYLPPPAGSEPGRVWVLFPGNAMRALDWLDVIGNSPNRHDGFLLIDYPGYGDCQGSPSPKAIEASSIEAFSALQKTLGATTRVPKICVLGISLGTGAGLQFATHHPVDKVILIAPFVSTLDEAKSRLGIPLAYLLHHRFDNRARLAELAARPNPPKVWIFHGTKDSTIPPSRGRALKAAFPKMITLEEIEDADHNSTLYPALDHIFQAMSE